MALRKAFPVCVSTCGEMVSMHFISLLLRRINRRAAAARPERRSINKLFSDRPRRAGVAINNSRACIIRNMCVYFMICTSVDVMREGRDETARGAAREREKRELRRFVVQGTIARCSYHSLFGRAPASSLSCCGSPPLDNNYFVTLSSCKTS